MPMDSMRPMARLTTAERNVDVLRPFGTFACIAPFNFPLALSTGMSAAALVAGNAVVYKPAEDAPLDRTRPLPCVPRRRVPDGVFNYLTGHAAEMGDALWQHPGIDGVVFTGSKAVGLRIHAGLARAVGSSRSCWSWGQERRDHHRVGRSRRGGRRRRPIRVRAPEPEMQRHIPGLRRPPRDRRIHSRCAPHPNGRYPRSGPDSQGRQLRTGDQSRAVDRYLRSVEQARSEGTVLAGGMRLLRWALAHGYFVAPTVARAARQFPLSRGVVCSAAGGRRSVRPGPGNRRDQRRRLRIDGRNLQHSPRKSHASSMRWKPASATRTSEAGPQPVPGPARSPSAAGKARDRPGRAAAAHIMSRSFMREQSRTTIIDP